ncbi:MAG: toll/interleukin-1 receptor domain-containing protein [Methyloceanibacter sp.]
MAGKIFINYRRGDDPGFAGRLFDRLEEAFTADRIFIGIDNIEPGLDFVRVLEDQVDRCDVLLAVIGPNWLTAKDENGERRLDNPNDFVRIEIESGLKLGKRIVPVLVNNAEMPRSEHLPESMRPLARRNAVRLTPRALQGRRAGPRQAARERVARCGHRAASGGDRRRNPGAALWRLGSRVWWIIAVLVLALILIFWLFASPPAQASAGTNFSASPLMQ